MPPEQPQAPTGTMDYLISTAKAGLPLLGLFLVVVLGSLVADALSAPPTDGTGGASGWMTDDQHCNVVGIEIRGCIETYVTEQSADAELLDPYGCEAYTSSEEVVHLIEQAAEDDTAYAVLLEIDSTGGSAVAAEEIATALKGLGKPTVAWIRGYGDSAAYWIASAADTIVASENSDVGSIGVTGSYVDNVRQNQAEGLTYNQLTSGKFKDMGSPERTLTQEERGILQRDLDIMHENFIRTVATNRELSIENVRALADGSTMLGAMAKEKGLVDVLGTKPAVWRTLEGAIEEEPYVCWP